MPSRKASTKQVARVKLRETFWPGSAETLWPLAEEKGWTRMPRTLPIIAEIINQKAVSGDDADLARTYLTLYSVAFAEGLVDVVDEDVLATVSGLKKKSWIARMLKLQALGLIDTKPKGAKRFGYVLLRHPVPIVRKLRADGKVEDRLWGIFEQQHTEFGCTEPLTPEQIEDRERARHSGFTAGEMADVFGGQRQPT